MTKNPLCTCGSCNDAVERGIQLVAKMVDDGECPVFVSAVVESASVAAMGLLCVAIPSHKAALLAAGIIRDQVAGTWTDDHYTLLMEAVKRHGERAAAEQDLPKGD